MTSYIKLLIKIATNILQKTLLVSQTTKAIKSAASEPFTSNPIFTPKPSSLRSKNELQSFSDLVKKVFASEPPSPSSADLMRNPDGTYSRNPFSIPYMWRDYWIRKQKIDMDKELRMQKERDQAFREHMEHIIGRRLSKPPKPPKPSPEQEAWDWFAHLMQRGWAPELSIEAYDYITKNLRNIWGTLPYIYGERWWMHFENPRQLEKFLEKHVFGDEGK